MSQNYVNTAEDFIRVWPNKINKDICQEYIDIFEEITNNPSKSSNVRRGSEQYEGRDFLRKDKGIMLSSSALNKKDVCRKILLPLLECVNEYLSEFSILGSEGLNHRDLVKVQRTDPSGGFHAWHFESTVSPTTDTVKRALAWTVYLNDMPDGEAETEFLFQRKRIKPTVGTVLIWPAGFTHTHRGNTVFTQPKYIATGWFYQDKQFPSIQMQPPRASK